MDKFQEAQLKNLSSLNWAAQNLILTWQKNYARLHFIQNILSEEQKILKELLISTLSVELKWT